MDVSDAAIAAGPHWPDHVGHGDFMPGNLLLDDAGHLASILDWGAAGIGDPAWTCWRRGRAWGRRGVHFSPRCTPALRRSRWRVALHCARSPGPWLLQASLPGFAAIMRHVLAQVGHDVTSARRTLAAPVALPQAETTACSDSWSPRAAASEDAAEGLEALSPSVLASPTRRISRACSAAGTCGARR